MKTIILSLLCVLCFANVNSQVTSTLQNENLPELPFDMGFYNNELYFILVEAGKIVKTDPSSVNAPLVDVLTGLVNPTTFRFIGTDLYYIEAADAMLTPNSGKLSKIDITQSSPTPTVIATGLNAPFQMEINSSATKVFISEVTFNPDLTFNQADLSVLDISGGSPIKTVIYNQYFNIEDLELKGNTLYIFAQEKDGSEGGPWKLYTFDATSTTPTTPMLYYDANTMFAGTSNGDFIYFTDSSNKIFRIDETSSSPNDTDVDNDLEYNNNDVTLYECISNGGNLLYTYGENSAADKFLLFETDISTLSIDDTQNKNTITLFPNPSNDFIKLKGIKQTSDYEIYNVIGKKVKHGQVSASESISIKALTNGIYFLNLEGADSFKFIKN